METFEPTVIENTVDAITAHVADERFEEVAALLIDMHAAEVANVIESLRPEVRVLVWPQVPTDIHGDVLAELGEEVLLSVISQMEPKELVAAASQMESNDLAEILEDVPDEISEEIKSSLSSDILERLENNLTFEDNTAGRLMSSDFISVRNDVSVSVVLRFLRAKKTLPENTDCLMVIDRQGHYLGKLPLQTLLTADEDDYLDAVMQKDDKAILGTMAENEVAAHFEDRDLLSVAVVDENQFLLGRITVDDVIDILREQATHAVMSGSGLDDEADLFAPVRKSVKSRSLWLGINLATAFLASWVIGLFEATIDQVVALAVLMPVVASMGGIAGSQTLALIIRGQALNQVSPANSGWLLKKEVVIGLCNGVLWSVVISGITAVWFKSIMIGLVLGMAIIITLIIAAFSGFVVPVMLKRLGIDPALSGSVILTTVTDVFGFMSFLGLATIFLI